MDTLQTNLKAFCLQSPHWMQLELQAFWYGLLSYTMEAAETGQPLNPKELSPETLLQHADPEFESWPTDWLRPYITEFTALSLNFQQQQDFFEQLETLFQDTIPIDLNIFTVLSEGEMLTEEQWIRLLDTVAFQPPTLMKAQKGFGKTRRTQGRRGITPLKRRKARTAHKKQFSTIHCLKVHH